MLFLLCFIHFNVATHYARAQLIPRILPKQDQASCTPIEQVDEALLAAAQKMHEAKQLALRASEGKIRLPDCEQKPSNSSPNDALSLQETAVPGSERCPPGMVFIRNVGKKRFYDLPEQIVVADFCVDQFEATLAQTLPDGNLKHWSPYHNPKNAKVRALSLKGAVPQANISGIQAKLACAESGKRLCSDSEWLRACGGPNQLDFPYGKEKRAGLCNDSRALWAPAQAFPKNNEALSKLASPCIAQVPDTAARSGAYEFCRTAEGVYDMMGNVHEWTNDPAGTFRGGYHSDTWRNGKGCRYATTLHEMPHFDYSTGFRCCADPKTAAIE